jgi:hypothetical protein
MTRPTADRVKVEWNGSGTSSPITLGSVVTSDGQSWQALPAALDGQVVKYLIRHTTALEAEAGFGVYTSAGNTLARTFRTYPQAGSLVSFSAGVKHVMITDTSVSAVDRRTTTPGASNDITQGYLEGQSTWLNTTTNQFYICTKHTTGAAVWAAVGGAGTGDMTKAVYDPGNINASAFLLSNHTGQVSAAQVGFWPVVADTWPVNDASGVPTNVILGSGITLVDGTLSASVAAGFVPLTTATISATTDAPETGTFRTYTNAGAIAVTLNASMIDGGEAVLRKATGSGTITISPGGGFTINGAGSSLVLSGKAPIKRIGTNFDVSGDINIATTALANHDAGGFQIFGNLAKVASASGVLTNTHAGALVLTTGAVTIPNTTGYNVTLLLGGDHNITFDGATFDISTQSWATGDLIGIIVTGTGTIRMTRVAAANMIDEGDF